MPDEKAGKGRIAVIVFTLDEEIHIGSCLDSVDWADEVFVVDSGSRDSTTSICESKGVRVFEHPFTGFGDQRNWALDALPITAEWVLILDADERVPPELADEIQEKAISAPASVGAFMVARRFHLWGRWLKHSSLYPSYLVRFVRRGRVTYMNRGHAETETVDGEIQRFRHGLIDENLKGVDDWFARQNRYSRKEAEYEADRSIAAGNKVDGVESTGKKSYLKELARRVPGRPLWYFVYAYFLRGGFLEGRDGFYFCYMRAIYYAMIQIKRYDISKGGSRDGPGA